ncbi:MAG: hypothetical protein IKS18_11330 [Lachnospiraceae bacterium]|nr:hypothetical protein [Lachnospiraceae bacterium]
MNKYYRYPSLQYWGDGKDLGFTALFEEDRLKYSESGKFLADSRSCRYLYTGFDDPKYIAFWEEMGCHMEVREMDGEKWALFVPKDVYDEPEKKYPVFMIFRPLEYYGMVFYRYFFEMAAQGEFIAIVYSSEDFDKNDIFLRMLDETIAEFHADPTRVYVTGHSHYGGLAVEFAFRHRDRIAGIAQMSDEAGVIRGFNTITDEKIEIMHRYDMPLINLGGTTDFIGIYPVNGDAQGIENTAWLERVGFKTKKADRIKTWQDRLYALNCRVPSAEEIENAGKNRAERVFGFPADNMFSFYAENTQHYVAQFYNADGKQHFTMVAVDNFTHAVSHVMQEMAWSFLRKFSRDQETKEIIEADF